MPVTCLHLEVTFLELAALEANWKCVQAILLSQATHILRNRGAGDLGRPLISVRLLLCGL